MSVQFANLGDVKPVVIAGGKDTSKFAPNLNMSFFDDEFYINLNRKDKAVQGDCATTADSKTKLSCGDDTDVFYIDKSGRFKWDIEFTTRPVVYSWTWELKHSPELEFYYQPELTAEEIKRGCTRPDEVVGSYAVYCNKANNKYKTGKLCHIYRPFCYDAKGNTIYADLKIADGQLTITIDAGWLNNAAYPVRLDPTLGYTSAGASGYNWDSSISLSMMDMVGYSAASSGTTDNIYIHASKQISSNMTIELGYYQSTARQAYTTKTGGWATGWNTLSFSGHTITSGNTYRCALSVYGDWGGSEAFGVSYDAVSNADQYWWDKISDTATYSSGDNDQVKFSVYLKYTASGGKSYYYQQQQM